MSQKRVRLFYLFVLLCLFFCEPVLSFDQTMPEKEYRNVLILENKDVYGVTDKKTEDGKYITVKIEGEEKVKVLLQKFTMKDDITLDTLKSDKTHKLISEIMTIENMTSVKLLREWLKDKNPLNRDKAAYLLGVIGNTSY